MAKCISTILFLAVSAGVFDIGASGASSKEHAQPARAGLGSRATAGKPWSVPEAPICMPLWPIWGLWIFRIWAVGPGIS
jgi:hypothetical protein